MHEGGRDRSHSEVVEISQERRRADAADRPETQADKDKHWAEVGCEAAEVRRARSAGKLRVA
jgi:hypothetical protein